MVLFRRCLLGCLALVLSCTAAWHVALAEPSSSSAAAVQPLLADLQWRLLGPFRGGRVLAVTGVPNEPRHFYFGSVNGGVWESQDAGRTWLPIFDEQGIGSIGAIAIAPSDPRVIYVGTGEADMRSDIAHGDGIYKSVDAGKHWVNIGLQDTRQIGRIVVDPTNADIAYVAALGHAYGPNEQRGVFRTRDGGKSWQKILYRDADTGAIDLALQPDNPAVLYAALWQTRRPPWSVYPPSNGPGSGLYKSTDGGDHWQPLTQGFAAAPGRIGLAIAPSAPQRVYAMVDAAEGGLYRSDDGGAHWTRRSADSRIWQRGWYFGGITVEPKDPNAIYACNTAMYRSSDGGKTFVPIKGAPGGDDYHTLWIDPAEPARRMLGVDQGALVSLNGGDTWSSWFNQPTGQFYHLATDNRFPYWIYGAQQDSGAAGIPSRSTTAFDGVNLTQFKEVTAGGESDSIAPDPDDPEIVYGGRVDRLNLRTQQTHSIDPTLNYPDHYRSEWTLPLVFSKTGPRTLYFANQRLFATRDAGAHWRLISPDLTREHPDVPATLDTVTAAGHDAPGDRRGVIYTIAPSPLNASLLWLGTDDGLIWTSRDAGRHWRDVTPSALTAWSKIGIVEASHFDALTAYAAIDRHRLDDDRPAIYRTRDGGASWQLIVDGIDPTHAMNVVREDPKRRGLLYAGSEKGIWVSLDDGTHWQRLQNNLPVTSVRDIEVHGDDVVVATHGRAFWVLDDVAPLRQLAATGTPSVVTLFKPSIAVRLRVQGFTGSPMPKDEPMATNPPAGANLDYWLPAEATNVTLRILDTRGHEVRRYDSGDDAPAADLEKLQIAPEWFSRKIVPSRSAGLHRLTWDLRRLQAPVLAEAKSDTNLAGVWSVPGRYTVELAVDGVTQTQRLQLDPDPRVPPSASAYAQQFALATAIETERARISTAVAEATRLHVLLVARRSDMAADAALAAAIADTDTKLVALTDLEVDKDPRNSIAEPPHNLEGFRFLGAALARLQEAVDGADAAPTTDAKAGFMKLHTGATHALAAFQGFTTGELATLDARLKAAGRPSLVEVP